MVDVIADLHLHSKYSRAVSPQMTLPVMAQVGEQKGIQLLTTGDWTHPLWLREIKNYLEEEEEGLYKIKKRDGEDSGQARMTENTRFLLSVEIATIFSQNGKGRRIHQLVFVPSLETAEKVNKELLKRGFNLSSDGRPIIGLSSKNLLQLVLEIDERSFIIPAHVWTPWFGIYGQMSGFNSLQEAYEELAPYVYGIETGLSSDPEMNWQMEELKTRSILSFSDAHSPAKMGREATVFRLESLSYENIRQAVMRPSLSHSVIPARPFGEGSTLVLKAGYSPLHGGIQGNGSQVKPGMTGDNGILYTIEFYPEEGKYHYSGHRNCGITMTPEEQAQAKNICPICKRKLTDGVMRRVQELAVADVHALHKANAEGLVWITNTHAGRPPFVKIVPLQEIIAESIGSPVTSPKVKVIFDHLCREGQSEFHVLLKLPLADIDRICQSITTKDFAQKITDGIKKVREEKIVIQPGYDGVFGVVKIWDEEEKINVTAEEKEQIGLGF